MLNLRFKSSTSAFFEIDNNFPYYGEFGYDVYLNGKTVIQSRKENFFSLFSLLPDTEYEICVLNERIVFCTESESGLVSVSDFGASGDGVSDDSEAIRKAIACCPKNGRVYIPEGVYLTEPIVLKSDMTLELARGAVLLGYTDTSRYPVLPAYVNKDGEDRIYSVFEGSATPCYASFISAYFEKNVNIIGEGIIDGNAHKSVWWTHEYVKDTEKRRPRLLFLNGCENVNLHGIVGKNSPSWNFHPFFSKKLGFYDMKVEANKNSPNTDGLNPECCESVDIIGCRFSVGDDCIAIKSGKIEIGMKYKTPSSGINIRNCLMEFGHGGVVLGSEISGGVKDLSVTKCIFRGTERGLRIKTRRGRGKYCVVDGICFENILMDKVGIPFVINMHYNCDSDGNSDYVQTREPLAVDDRTPYIGSFEFKDIVCSECQGAAAYFEGLAERPIGSVIMENVSVSFACDAKEALVDGFLPKTYLCRSGMYIKNVGEVRLKNVEIKNFIGDKIISENTPLITEE